jgi:hypothetical protein
MADIFLSYSSKDRDRAKAVVKALERQGWSIWWDTKIGIGKTWDDVLEEQIAASRAMVVLWSQASIKSRWVKNEARVGHRRGVLLPVLIEPIDPPLEFSDIQAADLSNWSGDNEDTELTRLIQDLQALLKLKGHDDLSVVHSAKDIIEMLSSREPSPLLMALSSPSRVEGTYKGVFTDSDDNSGAGSVTISLSGVVDEKHHLDATFVCELLFSEKSLYTFGDFDNTSSIISLWAFIPTPTVNSQNTVSTGSMENSIFGSIRSKFSVKCKLSSRSSSLEGNYFFGIFGLSEASAHRKGTFKLVKQ